MTCALTSCIAPGCEMVRPGLARMVGTDRKDVNPMETKVKNVLGCFAQRLSHDATLFGSSKMLLAARASRAFVLSKGQDFTLTLIT